MDPQEAPDSLAESGGDGYEKLVSLLDREGASYRLIEIARNHSAATSVSKA